MRSVTARLVVLLMLALMAITGAYDYFRLTRERERLVAQLREDERIFSETLALAVSRNVRWGRTSAELKELLDDLLARPGLVAVAIYDPQGQVIAFNVAPDAVRPAADATVRQVLVTKEAAAGEADAGPRRVLRYVQPFRWPGGRTAAVEVQQSLDVTEKTFRDQIRERILWRLGILTAFVLSLVAVTRWSLARPMRAMIQGARAVGRGDLGQRIRVRRRDEVGELADEFNRMASSLETAHRELLRQGEERVRLEREVEQAQKMAAIGMLATEVAHEIGTPLNVISGRAEVLDRTLPEDHPGRRHLDLILKQTERIGGIVRALLDYSRPRRPALRAVALGPVVTRVAELAEDRCRAKGVRVQLDLPTELPEVLGDPDHLQQLFLNLVLNALDASRRGGVIRVTSGPTPVLPPAGRAGITRGKVEAPALDVHVVDGGDGIPAERLDHVFQPFFSTKGEGHGTGLGLPIAEEIARAHHGEIEILSIPGAGTEVVVRLPAVRQGERVEAGPLFQEARPVATGDGV